LVSQFFATSPFVTGAAMERKQDVVDADGEEEAEEVKQ
jgi:hypothetical protein